MSPPTVDELLNEALAPPPTPAATRALGPAKLRYTHEDCVDFIIANPGISQGALAARYGYSQSWMSTVINSDAFQARLAARREELVDPTLALTINERFAALTVRSLEVLQEKLSRDPVTVPDQLALQAAQLGAKSLGLGAQPVAPAATKDDLAVLANRLIAFQRAARSDGAVDVEVKEIRA